MEQNEEFQPLIDETPFYALLAIGSVFTVLVAAGWGAILNGEFNFSGPWKIIGLCCGIAIAGVSVMMAKAVAKERIKNKDQLRFNNVSAAAAYFCLLFIFSSVGTMNTLYRFLAQGEAVHAIITTTIGHLYVLEASAETILATPKIDQKRNKVKEIRIKFNFELTNIFNCGMGPVALKHFITLQAELPALVRLTADANTVNNCKEATKIQDEYNRYIDESLQSFLDANYQEEKTKQTKLKEIKELLDEQIKQLGALQQDTTKMQISDLYQPALQKSWDAYQKHVVYINNEFSKGGVTTRLPEVIVNKDIQTLKENKGITIIELLIKQWDSIRSIGIFIVAITVDLIMCIAYLTHLKNNEILIVSSRRLKKDEQSSRIKDLIDKRPFEKKGKY